MAARLLSKLFPQRLQYQLLLLIALLFVGAMLFYTKTTGDTLRAHTLALQEHHAQGWLRHLTMGLRPLVPQSKSMQAYVHEVRLAAGADYVVVWHPDGSAWVSSGKAELALPARFTPPPGLSPHSTSALTSADGITIWAPVSHQEGQVEAWVESHFNDQLADEMQLQTYASSAVVGLLLLILMLLLVLAFLYRPMRALAQAGEFARHLKARKDSLLVVQNAPREIQTLVDALNQAAQGQAEQAQALQEERSHTTAILESALDCIVSIDNAGRITEFNPAAEKTFGYRRDEVMGEIMGNLLIPVHLISQHLVAMQPYQSKGADSILGHRREVMARRRDGSEFPAEIAVVAIHLDGKPEFTAYLRDITQRKQAADALVKARDAAEDANRTKSEFLANMSHEIRTPMNAIIGMTDLVLDTPLDQEQYNYLSMVKSSADSLLGIINEVLDFSKIEAGHLDVENVTFSLHQLLGMTVRALAPRAAERDIELLIQLAQDVPDALVGDPHRVRQVLTNLMSNALKFTERGEVEVSTQVFSQHNDHITLQFNVRDTGIGIPKDKQRLIFGAFAQADASTTRKYGGTGLGLAISERIVNTMGGRIWVDSHFGQGSVFHFTVSFGLRPESLDAPHPTELKDLRILVVDDNERHRALLGDMLSAWDCHAFGAASSSEAIEQIEGNFAQNFSLILLDSSLTEPGVDALIDHIKALPIVPPIVLMHPLTRPISSNNAIYADIPRLQKPLLQQDVLIAVMAALGYAAPLPQKHSGSGLDSSQPLQSFDLLLAEDNPINQTLAIRLLEKLGHHVNVVNNGREAVDAVRVHAYDAVLMDIQMPVMGGFEASAEIRVLETELERHTPIIAMTAHAMAGDRERCLAAGMDEYVAKPIQTQALSEALQRAIGHNQNINKGETMDTHSPYDQAVLVESLGGDMELYAEIVGLFLNHYPKEIEALQRELAAGNAANLQRTAHSLKGAVSNFAATRATEAARVLEHTMKNGMVTNTAELVEEAIAAVEELASALKRDRSV